MKGFMTVAMVEATFSLFEALDPLGNDSPHCSCPGGLVSRDFLSDPGIGQLKLTCRFGRWSLELRVKWFC